MWANDPKSSHSLSTSSLSRTSGSPTSSISRGKLNNWKYRGSTPLTVHRGCTDIPCLLVFLIAVLGLVGIIGSGTAGETSGHFRCPFGQGDGDLMRFGQFRDFQGHVCGEDGRGNYLYFCKVGTELDLRHHVCVEECPTGATTYTQCYNSGLQQFESMTDYPTVDFAGLFCMPADRGFSDTVDGMLSKSSFMDYMVRFTEAARARELLGLSGVTALALALMYLFLLEHATYCLMWTGFLVVIAVPGLIGGFLIDASGNGGLDNGPLSSGDAQYDLAIGAGCATLSFIFFCVVICKRESINLAAECVEKAAACIFAVPSLVLEPLLALLTRILFFVPLLIGFLMLLSCGNVTDSIDLTKQTFFEFNGALKLLLVYYAFMIFWVMEFCTALSQFVVAYTVEVWWFEDNRWGGHKGRAAWGVIHGYCLVLEHHLGTLLLGSIAVGLTRVLRMAVGIVAGAASDTANPASVCLGEICCCCVECYKQFLEFITKNAYMDVAMNATGFCKGGKHAVEVLATEGTAAAVTHGTTSILQLAGLGGVAATGALITWELSTKWVVFSDPDSEHYVEDPSYLAILSAVISFAVALPFLHIFDIVTDTILYCEAHEEMCRLEEEELSQAGGCCKGLICNYD